MIGKLYGVGVGPGDPELITLKAARLIASADIVAYPTLAGAESFARKIAASLIPDGAAELAIDVPMVVTREPAQAAYDGGAAKIAKALDAGHDVVVLCEGDPFFYGSFMYLFARLCGDYEVEVVPGVSSVNASAARSGLPLVARNEVLTVVPGPLDDDLLKDTLGRADSFAIMKVGRHMARIRAVLSDLGLVDRAVYVERVGLAEERICPLNEAPDNAPYFSMILLSKGGDPWL